MLFQACTAVTEQRRHTARRRVNGSCEPWTQSTRSWRAWLTSVEASPSPKTLCGNAFWVVLTLRPKATQRPPRQPRWTAPSSIAALKPIPHSAGRLTVTTWHFIWTTSRSDSPTFVSVSESGCVTYSSTELCVRRSAPTGELKRGRSLTSSASTALWRQISSPAWQMWGNHASWAAKTSPTAQTLTTGNRPQKKKKKNHQFEFRSDFGSVQMRSFGVTFRPVHTENLCFVLLLKALLHPLWRNISIHTNSINLS